MRTEYCGLLRPHHIGKQVTLCGWVNKYRNLGSIIFIDMRDCEGIVQIFFDLDRTNTLEIASELRNEFCIQITGIVRARAKENVNAKMTTGSIEVLAEKLIILSRASSLPIDFNQTNSEETRLKYRYLDLRRMEMSQHLKTRAKITGLVHHFMNTHNFLNIETPVLTKATPEGARDYLVPSRIHKSKFYALPQSPQLFKQLLMISGFERYYQIVKCFRDEDLRADRQPEFTQVDVEISFATAEQVRKIMEKLVRKLWKKIKGVDLKQFPIMTFSETERRFGSDKPDLRNPLELVDVSDLLSNIDPFFSLNLTNDLKWHVIALRIPNKTLLSRRKIDNYNEFVKNYNIGKFFYIRVREDENGFNKIIGGIAKFLNSITIKALLKRVNAQNEDIIFFGAGNKKEVISAMGALRLKLGKDLNLTDQSKWEPVWIIDFPMFKEESEGCMTATHHPFTSPKNLEEIKLKNTPLKIIANSYDMVINGCEIGSGSVRIHDLEIQKIVFEILGINEQEQYKKFGFLLEAMKFGAPPHAGFALGLDRLTMLLTGTDNIRDVIAFPKTTSAACLMTEAPSFIDETTLMELNI